MQKLCFLPSANVVSPKQWFAFPWS